MQLINLSMSFGDEELFENVNLQISDNEKVGVVGVNGAGKTTFFKLIMEIEEADSGKIVLGNNRVSWLPQVLDDSVSSLDISVFDFLLSGRPIERLNRELQDNYEKLSLEKDENKQKKIFKIINNLQKKLDYWECYTAENVLLKIIDGMNIDDSMLEKKLSELSGGQKSKVAFARLLYSIPEIILLDEPTNHLDPETQTIIADTFKNFPGTMLVVSHNPEFVDNLGIERTLILPDGIISYYDRSLPEYFYKLNTKHSSK